MRANTRRAKARARSLRLRHGQDKLPIAVEDIAKLEGVRIERADLGVDVSALLVESGDEVVIGVNAHHVETRQRFSIAHELGHLVLHSGGRQLFVDKDFVVRFRDGVSGTGLDPQEVEANQFAAELLMPEDLVKRSFLEEPFDINNESALRQLAERFDVSSVAMAVRLSALDLVVAS